MNREKKHKDNEHINKMRRWKLYSLFEFKIKTTRFFTYSIILAFKSTKKIKDFSLFFINFYFFVVDIEKYIYICVILCLKRKTRNYFSFFFKCVCVCSIFDYGKNICVLQIMLMLSWLLFSFSFRFLFGYAVTINCAMCIKKY